MSPGARRESANEMRARHGKASRPDKTRMLAQSCGLTGYHRKSANRLLLQDADARPKKRRGRPPVYRGGPFMSPLLLLREAGGYNCGKYFKAAIPALMAKLEKKRGILYGEALHVLLHGISAATIDRLLKPQRQKRLPQRYMIRADWPRTPLWHDYRWFLPDDTSSRGNG